MRPIIFYNLIITVFFDGLTEKKVKDFKRNSYPPSKLRQNSVRAKNADGMEKTALTFSLNSDGAEQTVYKYFTAVCFLLRQNRKNAKMSFDGGQLVRFLTVSSRSVKTFRFFEKKCANFYFQET